MLSKRSISQLFFCIPQALTDQLEMYSNLSSIPWIWEGEASVEGIFSRCLNHFHLASLTVEEPQQQLHPEVLLNPRPPHPVTHIEAVPACRENSTWLLASSISFLQSLPETCDRSWWSEQRQLFESFSEWLSSPFTTSINPKILFTVTSE